jgi:hypothetical protein
MLCKNLTPGLWFFSLAQIGKTDLGKFSIGLIKTRLFAGLGVFGT